MRILLIASLFMALLTACTQAPNNNSYKQDEVGSVLGRVQKGHIVSLRQVSVQDEGDTGTAVGAVLGGIGGSTIGQGKGSLLGAVVGAVIGAGVGSAVEREQSRKDYTEFMIQLRNGSLVAVVQSNEDKLGVGDAVLIVQAKSVKLIRDTITAKTP